MAAETEHHRYESPPTASEAARAEARSLATILRALDDEPIVDGECHPAEAILDRHLDAFGAEGIARAIFALHADQTADCLKLLGRTTRVDPAVRERLIPAGLASPSIAVRDAAIQAVENWEDRGLVVLLRHHREPVGWLADYAANVVRDLQS